MHRAYIGWPKTVYPDKERAFLVMNVSNEFVDKRQRTYVASSGLENVISTEELFSLTSTFLIGPIVEV
jgi:hypothetical protein